MAAAEDWLRAHGAVKVQLMVRHSNQQATAFYERLGYDDADVSVLARWLAAPPGSPP
jgi:ribosomal protein S18 acetylase RimI-like enzyme